LAASAYVAALTMLARRELSTAQIRQRLQRRSYTPEEIDEAITRLTAERSLDDARTAGALARTQLRLQRRGPARVRRTIEAAGVSRELATQATAEAYEDVDLADVMKRALDARLDPEKTIPDERTFRRLFRYLVTQGFEPDRVLALLRARRHAPARE